MHFEEDGQKQEAEYDYSASAMARDDALAAQYHEDVDHIGTQDEGFRKTGF